jgi:hypothetical protein
VRLKQSPAGQGDGVGQTMLMCERRRRRAGRPGGNARGGALKAGEDGTREEDVEEADTRRSPEDRGRSERKPPRSEA